ncbi:stress-induced protein [Nannochloropsis gaditana]|uniref:Stress-induced protein n=1 Tax=Nannochloropsis gaditana TaxID=72520 RepID=W7TBU8_9STRA|nr:stress-induced protein [Nannochloropsis gaditana]
MSAPTCTGETPSASSHQSVEKEEKADKDKTTEGSNEEDEEYRVLAERYKDEGNAAFKEGRYKEALALYTQGVAIDPDNHVLYSNRSAAFLKESERGKALKDAERLMEIKPDWPKSYSRKGAAQHALTRYAIT